MTRFPTTSILPFAFLLLLGFLSGGGFALADDPAFYAHQAEVLPPDTIGQPVRVVLPAPLLRQSRSALNDILLWDDAGSEVPTVILSEPPNRAETQTLSFRVDHYDEGPERAVLLLRLDLPEEETVPFYDRVEILTRATDFRKTVSVSRVEPDNTRTELAVEGIYDFSSKVPLRKTTVHFPAQAARVLELSLSGPQTVDDNDPTLQVAYRDLNLSLGGASRKPFKITGVSAQTVARQGDDAHLDRLTLAPTTEETTPKKESVFTLDPLGLPVQEIRLNVENAYYHRQVFIQTAEAGAQTPFAIIDQGSVTRLPGMNESDQRLSIRERFVNRLRLLVANGDSPPLKVTGVELRFPRRHLVFIPEKGRTYVLYIGAEKRPPRAYDLAGLLTGKGDLLAEYTPGSLGTVQANPSYDPEKATRLEAGSRAFYEHWVFTAVIVLVVALMALWFIGLVRRLPPPKPGA